jgi:hypothetical protein
MGTIQIDGSTPKLTIGNATAEDALILFDGNAQDFYIGLDDSADDLIIGLGSAVGTTPAISINEDRDVTISDGAIDFDVASHDTSNGLKLGGTLVTATAAELNIMDGVTSTAAEINLIDGGTARGTTALADGDGILINDAGTMRMTNVTAVKTYMSTTLDGIDDQSSSNDDQITITDSAVVINEDSDDLDFRIEGNSLANLFYVDAGEDKIYMGVASKGVVAAGHEPSFYMEGTNDSDSTIGLTQNSNNNSGPSIIMTSTRGTSVGATTIVQDDDYLGNIYFGGADGNDRVTYGATIVARVDGTPGENDLPARLVFATTADGAATPTDRMSIDKAGNTNVVGTFSVGEYNIPTNTEIKFLMDESGYDAAIGMSAASLADSTATSALSGANIFIARISSYGIYTAARSAGGMMDLNRCTNDGEIASFRAESTQEGTISVSGSTVSYNAFCGSHWSRLADNSKPTILRGTVMESIATMMDWYQIEYEITLTKKYKEGDTIPLGKEIGDEYDDKTLYKESIALPDGKSVGDNHTITNTLTKKYKKWDTIPLDKKIGDEYTKEVERTGKIIKENNERLPKCKISDTEDSKAVYGVFMGWDDEDDGNDGDVNDMYVAAIGAFVVRIHKDETVAIGDYLQSNGDGTAKVQADDILRASTIAKVTSTEKTHIHADDSYCVPCTLHCG